MLAYCGINCATCKAYKATMSGNRKALLEVGLKFSKGTPQPEDWVCLGCHAGNRDFLAKYCRDCGIRACAIQRDVQNCAVCDDFDGCQKLQPFLKDEGVWPQRTMSLLRQTFLSRPQATS